MIKKTMDVWKEDGKPVVVGGVECNNSRHLAGVVELFRKHVQQYKLERIQRYSVFKEAKRDHTETWEKIKPWEKCKCCDFEVDHEEIQDPEVFEARKELLQEEVEGRKLEKALKNQKRGKF